MLNSKFWVSQTVSGEQAWRHANLPSLERKLLNLCRHSASLGDLYAQFNNLGDLESTVSILLQKDFIRLSAFRPGQTASSSAVLPDANQDSPSQSRQEISSLLSKLRRTTRTSATTLSTSFPSALPSPVPASTAPFFPTLDPPDPAPALVPPPSSARADPAPLSRVPADLRDFLRQLNDTTDEDDDEDESNNPGPTLSVAPGSPVPSPSPVDFLVSSPPEFADSESESAPAPLDPDFARHRAGSFEQLLGLGSPSETTTELPPVSPPPLPVHHLSSSPDPFAPPDLFPPLDSVNLDFDEDLDTRVPESPDATDASNFLGLAQLSHTILGTALPPEAPLPSAGSPPAPSPAPSLPDVPISSRARGRSTRALLGSPASLETSAPVSSTDIDPAVPRPPLASPAPVRDPLFTPAQPARDFSAPASDKFSKLGQSISQIQSLQAQRRAAKAKGKAFLRQKQQAREEKLAAMNSPHAREKIAKAQREQEAKSFRHMADVLKNLNKGEH